MSKCLKRKAKNTRVFILHYRDYFIKYMGPNFDQCLTSLIPDDCFSEMANFGASVYEGALYKVMDFHQAA